MCYLLFFERVELIKLEDLPLLIPPGLTTAGGEQHGVLPIGSIRDEYYHCTSMQFNDWQAESLLPPGGQQTLQTFPL